MYNFTLALHCISQNILQYTLYCAYTSVHYSALPQCTVLYCTLYSTERKISLQCIYHSPLLHSVLCTLWDTSSPFCIMNCTALCGNVGGWEGWGGHITHVSLQMTYALILLYTVLYSVSSLYQSPKWLIAREMVEISPAPALSCVCQFGCLHCPLWNIWSRISFNERL